VKDHNGNSLLGDVFLETRARREYREFSARAREQVTDAIDDLQADPRPPGSRTFVGATGYLIRTGNYRSLYTNDDSASRVCIYQTANAVKFIAKPKLNGQVCVPLIFLITTMRLRRVSLAFHTSPMPPLPS
jgi:mRNA-degrading endonuclease RelE of RelBE toxin-antitoxin system